MYDDLWDNLLKAHSKTASFNSLDGFLTGKDRFTSVQQLTDTGRKAMALPLPVSAGTRVVFAGDMGSILSMQNPPEVGMTGEVVNVKSAKGDITSYEGMVFVKWADGQFRQVSAEYLRPVARKASVTLPSEEDDGKPYYDEDFKAGFAAGKAALAKKPDIDSSEAKKAYKKVSLKHGSWWEDGFKAAISISRGITTKATAIAQRMKLAGQKSNQSYRIASLGDLTQFMKVAEGKLVHKATKDLWSFSKDDDGSFVVERLFDANGKPLKV